MRLRSTFLAAAFALAASVGSGLAGQTATYDQVAEGLAKGDIVVVDVREPDEFAAGHLAGAVNLPLSRFDPTAVPHPTGKTVVVMCRSGNRSGRAMAMLAGAGRGDVVDYSGSMNDWVRRGGPLVQGR